MTFRDEEHLNRIIRKIARLLGTRVDSRVPVLDKSLPEGGTGAHQSAPFGADTDFDH
jgi:Flp pilus assembly CpaF family ATPase